MSFDLSMKHLSFFLLSMLFLGCTGHALSQDKVGDKLETLVLPVLNFQATPLGDAIAFLRQKSVELDPEKKGVNIAILNQELRNKPVTLRLRDIPIGDAIRYTSLIADAHMKKGDHAVTIVPKKEGQEENNIEYDTTDYRKRLNSIIVPSIEFHETPLIDALEFLAAKSRELDEHGKGINIVCHRNPNQNPITLRLNNIPLGEALRYAVEIADHQPSVETHAVVISPK